MRSYDMLKMKLCFLYLAIAGTYMVTAQSEFKFSEVFGEEKRESFALYENENNDEFRLGISFQDQKGFLKSISLLFDDDFATGYMTYTLKDFFVFDFNFEYGLGPFDLFLSIENLLALNTNSFFLEPIYELRENLRSLSAYEQEFAGILRFGIVYNF